MIVVATEIRVRTIAGLVRFFPRAAKVGKQVKAADGLVFAKLRGFRTLTGWESEAAMQRFRNSAGHREAMRSTAKIGAAKSTTWSADAQPDWSEARKRLAAVSFR